MSADWKAVIKTTMTSGHKFEDELYYKGEDFSMKDILDYASGRAIVRGFRGIQDIEDIKVEIINYI